MMRTNFPKFSGRELIRWQSYKYKSENKIKYFLFRPEYQYFSFRPNDHINNKLSLIFSDLNLIYFIYYFIFFLFHDYSFSIIVFLFN